MIRLGDLGLSGSLFTAPVLIQNESFHGLKSEASQRLEPQGHMTGLEGHGTNFSLKALHM